MIEGGIVMHKMSLLGASMFVFAAVVGCGGGGGSPTGSTAGSGGMMDAGGVSFKAAKADIKPSTGQTAAGTAVFTSNGAQVTLVLTLEGLAPNTEHAVHIHEMPHCGMDGMEAMGHWNPTNEAHGKWGEAPYHRGDIGNVTADASGKASLKMTTDQWAVSSRDVLKDVQDHAFMVHASPDDFTTQPTGDAGARIGCGPIMMLETD
jgi:Cu-Zn family superoxide dismutase